MGRKINFSEEQITEIIRLYTEETSLSVTDICIQNNISRVSFYKLLKKHYIKKRLNKTNIDQFILESKKIHGNKFDYSKVIYKNINHKVIIRCIKHKEFEVAPYYHLKKEQGCPICSKEKTRKRLAWSNEKFILEANKTHNYIYDYSKINYINANTKVKIICKKHGIFEQIPSVHIRGRGCNKCGRDKFGIKCRKSQKQYIKEVKKIHGNRYDYSKVKYIKSTIKIKIICPKHGEFLMAPVKHLNYQGCSKCKLSKGELKILNVLNNIKIQYNIQKKFKECKNINPLPFDFYLPNYNLCIEYDGELHYKSIKFFGGKQAFQERQVKDKIKTDFCKNNNINLLRIPYWEKDNIEKILTEYLENLTI